MALRSIRLTISVLLLVSVAVQPSQAASNLGTISGVIRDSAGGAVPGALVIVSAATEAGSERLAFSDRFGRFSIPNLFSGSYSVRVTMRRFLPVFKSGVEVRSGASAVLTVSLQNALDVVRRVSARSNEDIVWMLRAATVTQPALRLIDEPHATAEGGGETKVQPGYSGYLQVYSQTVGDTARVSDGVGSQFGLSMPLSPGSRVRMTGQYTETPDQPRGFGAVYEFSPTERHRTAVGMNVRQGSLFTDPARPGVSREFQLQYDEDFQFTDNLVFSYGAEAGQFVSPQPGGRYFRPNFGLTWVPSSKTTFSLSTTRRSPDTRDSFGGDSLQRTSLIPAPLQAHAHHEASLTTQLGPHVDAGVEAFEDRAEAQAVFFRLADGRRGVAFLDTSDLRSSGVRLTLGGRVKDTEMGVSYSRVTGVAVDRDDITASELQSAVRAKSFHSVVARVTTQFEPTQTRVTAVYRWLSDTPVTPLDSYQRNSEFNDPNLSISLTQDLPSWRLLPGRVQAIVDARNILEMPAAAHRRLMSPYPRLLKGGISIKF